MTRFATILTAAAVLAGSAQLALAERAEVNVVETRGTVLQVPAGTQMTSKELHRAGLTADDLVSVTILPEGVPSADIGRNR